MEVCLLLLPPVGVEPIPRGVPDPEPPPELRYEAPDVEARGVFDEGPGI